MRLLVVLCQVDVTWDIFYTQYIEISELDQLGDALDKKGDFPTLE